LEAPDDRCCEDFCLTKVKEKLEKESLIGLPNRIGLVPKDGGRIFEKGEKLPVASR